MHKSIAHCLVLLLIGSGLPTGLSENDSSPWGLHDPVPPPDAVVQLPVGSFQARFTVLTDRMIRIEFGRKPENRKTIAVVNRKLPVPRYRHETKGGILTLKTKYLTLKYELGRAPSKNTLKISGKMTNRPNDKRFWTWGYGDVDPHNLGGTIRTLDGRNVADLNCSHVSIEEHCTPGLISRSGYTILNDSNSWTLNKDDWWAKTPNQNVIDIYMLGYGHMYKQALADYTKIGGKVPLIPRYAFGVWFSRWYDYNPTTIRSLIEKYEHLSLPLDVLVLDMNWHTKHDWTGYSWDHNLYLPTSDAVAYPKHRNLALTMNLHDASGVNPWETQYEDFCKKIGIDASEGRTIPFSIVNQTTFLALEDHVLKPLEDQNGVDFWWIDWQQGETWGGGDGNTKNPTIWTAHVRSTDRYRRRQNKRAMVLARWGGLGGHRYPVHFSGDASVDWQQLSYQPYFSMTGTNVGALWSHDITGQIYDPELVSRWLQWSVFSGVSRVHDKGMSAGSCANSDPETCTAVEPWIVPPQYADANYKVLRMRASLIPYIYTAAARAHRSGLWFVTPMYYDWPEHELAYETASPHPSNKTKLDSQYMFGDRLMVAPVVRQANSSDELARVVMWFPPGRWIGYPQGRMIDGHINGQTTRTLLVDLQEVPVFAKAGAIIPRVPVLPGSTIGMSRRQYSHLVWTVCLDPDLKPTNTGEGVVYEDDGETNDYLDGAYAFTKASYQVSTSESHENRTPFDPAPVLNLKLTFSIETKGSYEGLPRRRTNTVRFLNVLPPTQVSIGQKALEFSRFGGSGTWSFSAEDGAVVVEIPTTPTAEKVSVEMFVPSAWRGVTMKNVSFKIARSLAAKAILDEIRMVPGSQSGQAKSPAYLQKAASIGSTLEAVADKLTVFAPILETLENLLVNALHEVESIERGQNCTGPAKEGTNPKICRRFARAKAMLSDAVG